MDLNPNIINNSISSLNDIITTAAMRTFHPKKPERPKIHKTKKNGRTWFDKECQKYRRISETPAK